MQLILNTDSMEIDIKEKNSSLEQESLGEMPCMNGNQESGDGEVCANLKTTTGNEENIQDNNICDKKGNSKLPEEVVNKTQKNEVEVKEDLKNSDENASAPIADYAQDLLIPDNIATTASLQDANSSATNMPNSDDSASVPATDCVENLPNSDSTANPSIGDSAASLPNCDGTASLPTVDGSASLPTADSDATLPSSDMTASLPTSDDSANVQTTENTADVPSNVTSESPRPIKSPQPASPNNPANENGNIDDMKSFSEDTGIINNSNKLCKKVKVCTKAEKEEKSMECQETDTADDNEESQTKVHDEDKLVATSENNTEAKEVELMEDKEETSEINSNDHEDVKDTIDKNDSKSLVDNISKAEVSAVAVCDSSETDTAVDNEESQTKVHDDEKLVATSENNTEAKKVELMEDKEETSEINSNDHEVVKDTIDKNDSKSLVDNISKAEVSAVAVCDSVTSKNILDEISVAIEDEYNDGVDKTVNKTNDNVSLAENVDKTQAEYLQCEDKSNNIKSVGETSVPMECDDIISVNSETKDFIEETEPKNSCDLDVDMDKSAAGSESEINNKDKEHPKPTSTDVEMVAENVHDSIDGKTFKQLLNQDDDIKVLSEAKDEIVDLDEVKVVEDEKKIKELSKTINQTDKVLDDKKSTNDYSTPTIRLSNTLDILSDDDEEPVKQKSTYKTKPLDPEKHGIDSEKQCINLDDDDDVMLIDEDVSKPDEKSSKECSDDSNGEIVSKDDNVAVDLENRKESDDANHDSVTISDKEPTEPERIPSPSKALTEDKTAEDRSDKAEKPKPLIPDDFFKSSKKTLAEMSRDDLEEFCILKIVESIIDRSSLNEIRTKLKTMALCIDEYKKKASMLTKQNRDLQVVLKSVQEEQKKVSDTLITPLKITRSVGMQVIMPDKNRRKPGPQNSGAIPVVNTVNMPNATFNRPVRNSNQNQRTQKQSNSQNNIPVPRLVPANNVNAVNKPVQNNVGKQTPVPNGVKSSPPPNQKVAEKRTHNRVQSITVDLTDDEPPSKQANKTSPAAPVRLVPPQNLLAPKQFPQNNPRKVYIPISGPQSQNIRPGQTVMLKSVPPPTTGPRSRVPPVVRVPQSSVRMGRAPSSRHPAPLPDAMKQYQPPNWKALPPAPDLKLSKVENGIVISWKIDGYQDDSYEEIASYQLYAYQETSSPPSTALWKKIGDVKALPLPMACTLTQFMAGYKYYFAVRAVDIRSRLGPFSLPGSILLLNKM